MENIELRSEGVRKIIGQVPPVLVRSGIGIISLVIALLLAGAAFVPYSETVECDVVVLSGGEAGGGSAFHAVAELPYGYIAQVQPGMEAEIEWEGYTGREYGYRQGRVTEVSPAVIDRNGENRFLITLSLQQKDSFLMPGMKGRASVVLSRRTVLERILH